MAHRLGRREPLRLSASHPADEAFPGRIEQPPQFTRGYGLVMGHGERKAMAMSLVDRALRGAEFGELPQSPAQDQEFVLPQGDSVEASGFVQHLKPFYAQLGARGVIAFIRHTCQSPWLDAQRVGEVGKGWNVALVTLMNERLVVGGGQSVDWDGLLELFGRLPDGSA